MTLKKMAAKLQRGAISEEFGIEVIIVCNFVTSYIIIALLRYCGIFGGHNVKKFSVMNHEPGRVWRLLSVSCSCRSKQRVKQCVVRIIIQLCIMKQTKTCAKHRIPAEKNQMARHQ